MMFENENVRILSANQQNQTFASTAPSLPPPPPLAVPGRSYGATGSTSAPTTTLPSYSSTSPPPSSYYPPEQYYTPPQSQTPIADVIPLIPDEELSTLNEPVYTTIWRDVFTILKKLWYVFIPKVWGGKGTETLKDWDLWGPLILCFILAIIIAENSSDSQATSFSVVFIVVTFGASAVTLNTKVLGGKISFFQGACVLGYCIFPLVIAALVLGLAKLIASYENIIFRCVVAGVATIWSIIATYGFIGEVVSNERKILAIYPLILFYLALGLFVVVE